MKLLVSVRSGAEVAPALTGAAMRTGSAPFRDTFRGTELSNRGIGGETRDPGAISNCE
jgi:hypothetical protein